MVIINSIKTESVLKKMQFLRCEKCNENKYLYNELKYLYKELYDYIKLCLDCLSNSDMSIQETVFNKFKDDQNLLGEFYYYGIFVKEDYKEAFKWFRRAAEQGNAGAQYNLGICYDNGEGVEQDRKEAFKWFRRASEQGNAEAQWRLGCWYEYGRGVEKSKMEAVKWYRRAAEQEHLKAQENFDYLINESEHKEELCRIFGISYELTNPSDYHIAVCLYKGILGYKKDKIMALNFFKVHSYKGNEKAKLFLKVYEELEVFPKELRDIIIEYYLE